jgi:hypothetical protein
MIADLHPVVEIPAAVQVATAHHHVQAQIMMTTAVLHRAAETQVAVVQEVAAHAVHHHAQVRVMMMTVALHPAADAQAAAVFPAEAHQTLILIAKEVQVAVLPVEVQKVQGPEVVVQAVLQAEAADPLHQAEAAVHHQKQAAANVLPQAVAVRAALQAKARVLPKNAVVHAAAQKVMTKVLIKVQRGQLNDCPRFF